MGLISKPLKATFPIVLKRELPETCFYFLGTGFFIGSDGSFLTARHVFQDCAVSGGGEFEGLMISNGKCACYPICDLNLSQQYDVALGQMRGVTEFEPLTLCNKDTPINLDVLTLEFSGTQPELMESGEKALVIHPYFRKGYVIRRYESTFPTSTKTVYMDLSFPALRGASGAPVIVERDGSVIGMVVGNVGRELLPAQIERVVVDGSPIEEIKYFLPTGLAISWVHLVDFVKSLSRRD